MKDNTPNNQMNFEVMMFDHNLSPIRKGFLILIVAFSVFLYADLNIFMYPSIISITRVLIILYYLYAVIISYNPNLSNRIILINFYIGIGLLFAFSSLLIIILKGAYANRAVQVYVVVLIGTLFFANLCRKYMSEIMLINLAFLIVIESVINVYHIGFLFNYFNIITLTIALAVSNKIYYASLRNQFESQVTLKKTIEDLKDEIHKSNILETRLKEMATKDHMTGCFSRNAGIELLKNHMQKSASTDQPLSIIYMDINRLKYINDHYGHSLGDHYIVRFVELIMSHSRSNDLLVRLGGDEFLMILPETNSNAAEHLWQHILEAFNHAPIHELNHTIVSASHGITEYDPSRHTSIDVLLEVADSNMYHEKRAHRAVLSTTNPQAETL